eukprot:m.41079 g.41079  ORF g.41079 m.41079 type:complete len:1589 (-) comp11780_c0_seq3:78-4844(-)
MSSHRGPPLEALDLPSLSDSDSDVDHDNDDNVSVSSAEVRVFVRSDAWAVVLTDDEDERLSSPRRTPSPKQVRFAVPQETPSASRKGKSVSVSSQTTEKADTKDDPAVVQLPAAPLAEDKRTSSTPGRGAVSTPRLLLSPEKPICDPALNAFLSNSSSKSASRTTTSLEDVQLAPVQDVAALLTSTYMPEADIQLHFPVVGEEQDNFLPSSPPLEKSIDDLPTGMAAPVEPAANVLPAVELTPLERNIRPPVVKPGLRRPFKTTHAPAADQPPLRDRSRYRISKTVVIDLTEASPLRSPVKHVLPTTSQPVSQPSAKATSFMAQRLGLQSSPRKANGPTADRGDHASVTDHGTHEQANSSDDDDSKEDDDELFFGSQRKIIMKSLGLTEDEADVPTLSSLPSTPSQRWAKEHSYEAKPIAQQQEVTPPSEFVRARDQGQDARPSIERFSRPKRPIYQSNRQHGSLRHHTEEQTIPIDSARPANTMLEPSEANDSLLLRKSTLHTQPSPLDSQQYKLHNEPEQCNEDQPGQQQHHQPKKSILKHATDAGPSTNKDENQVPRSDAHRGLFEKKHVKKKHVKFIEESPDNKQHHEAAALQAINTSETCPKLAVSRRISGISAPAPLLFDDSVSFEEPLGSAVGFSVKEESGHIASIHPSQQCSELTINLTSLAPGYIGALIAWLWSHVLPPNSSDTAHAPALPSPSSRAVPFHLVALQLESSDTDGAVSASDAALHLRCLVSHTLSRDELQGALESSNGPVAMAAEFQKRIPDSLLETVPPLTIFESEGHQTGTTDFRELFQLTDASTSTASMWEPSLFCSHSHQDRQRFVRRFWQQSASSSSASTDLASESHSDEIAEVAVVLALPSTAERCESVYALCHAATISQAQLMGCRVVHLPLSSDLHLDYQPLVLNDQQLDDLSEFMQRHSSQDTAGSLQYVPVLAFAFAGKGVRGRLTQVIGPSDPVLARRTDPDTLHAAFGQRRYQVLFCCSHASYSATSSDIVRWFGPRLHSCAVLDRPATSLVHVPSVWKAVLLLPVSTPLPGLFAVIARLADLGVVAQSYGFCRLALDNPGQKTAYFGFVLSLYGNVSNQRAILRYMVMACLKPHTEPSALEPASIDLIPLEGPECVLSAVAVDQILSGVGITPPQSVFNRYEDRRLTLERTDELSELPEVCVVTMRSKCVQDHWQFVSALQTTPGCHLIAAKYIPQLEPFQARELSPYELGHPLMKASVGKYLRSPLFCAAFGGEQSCDAIRRRLSELDLQRMNIVSDDVTVSASSQAQAQLVMLFFEREVHVPVKLFQPCLPLPQSWTDASVYNAIESVVFLEARFLSKVFHFLRQQHFLIIGGELCLFSDGYLHQLEDAIASDGEGQRSTQFFGSSLAFFIVRRINAVKKLATSLAEVFAGSSSSYYVPSTLANAMSLVSICRRWLDKTSPASRISQTPQLVRDVAQPSIIEVASVILHAPPETCQSHTSSVHDALVKAGYTITGLRVQQFHREDIPAKCIAAGQHNHSDDDVTTLENTKETNNVMVCFAAQRMNGITCRSTLLPPQLQRWLGKTLFVTESPQLSAHQLSLTFSYLTQDSVFQCR